MRKIRQLDAGNNCETEIQRRKTIRVLTASGSRVQPGTLAAINSWSDRDPRSDFLSIGQSILWTAYPRACIGWRRLLDTDLRNQCFTRVLGHSMNALTSKSYTGLQVSSLGLTQLTITHSSRISRLALSRNYGGSEFRLISSLTIMGFANRL